MTFLFLHQNFPGQFAHLAPALARAGHRVVALTSRVEKAQTWRGVEIFAYGYDEPRDQKLHPWLTTMNRAVDRATAVFRAATAMKAKGFEPDVVIAHTGWGEALFVRDVWPDARLGVFCEFFYRAEGADIDFDPEFANPDEIGRLQRVRMRNLAMRLQLESADVGISPTRWQADAHPTHLRERISVVHDGIDTDAIAPDPEAALTLEGFGTWSRADEVITFVNRNLEPYRGFHVFMRALPGLLRARPDAHIIVVGETGVSYGSAPKQGGTWKDALLAEIGHRISNADWTRVHFVGRIPREDFTSLLQISTVHLYLTYPFVLSWSLLEAMSAGCAVVASDTAPVREVVMDGETGELVDFFDGAGIVTKVSLLCDDAERRRVLGSAARAHVVANYDLRKVCLPRQFSWIERLAGL